MKLSSTVFGSITNVMVMPEAKGGQDHSLFQGFSLELIVNNQYLDLISILSTYPQHISEVCMDQPELIDFRNKISIPSFFFLSKNIVENRLSLLKDSTFLIITCLLEDLQFILELKKKLNFNPIVVSPSKLADINILDGINIFSFDKLLYEKFSQLMNIKEGSTESEYFNKENPLRTPWTSVVEVASINHNVTKANESVLEGLGFTYDETTNIDRLDNRIEFIESIIRSSSVLINKTGRNNSGLKSDLIIYSPSIYAHMYKFNSYFWNQILRRIKNPDIKKMISLGVFKNPNYSSHDIKVEKELPNVYANPDAAPLLLIRQGELRANLSAIELLGTAYNSPSIRLPNSINFHSSMIENIEFLVSSSAPNKEKKLKKKYKIFINELRSEIGEEIIEFVIKNSSSITICSDALIEWVKFDRIPLMFSHELSKIHTTPGNLFLQQSAQSVAISFTKQELLDITVIRSFNDEDPIKPILEKELMKFVDIDKQVRLTVIDVDSESQLIEELEKISSKILIFDCHGNHGGSESHGWLQIGDDKVDTWKLPLSNRLPPIIILSVCLTSAISGSHASVANGLLSSGAISVIGTLLPVDAEKAALFVGRILYRLTAYLSAIEKSGVDSITWRKFISGFLRMSYCTDILNEYEEIKKKLSKAQYAELQFQANVDINSYNPDWFVNFAKALSEILEISLEEIYNEIDEIGLTETMYYSQLGRPENIVINLKN